MIKINLEWLSQYDIIILKIWDIIIILIRQDHEPKQKNLNICVRSQKIPTC
jgi:hypothetical protein